MEPFATSRQHILAELERIDLLIRAQVWRARQLQGGSDELRGLYIAEEEVDALLERPAGLPAWATTPAPLSLDEVKDALEQMAATIAKRKAKSVAQGTTLRLDKLAALFELTPLDVDLLLVCLAPELDLRYERLYAYLQDDVTKKRPSLDLALNLLSPSFEEKLDALQRLTPSTPLLEHGLLILFDDPSHKYPPLLSKYVKVDERVVGYLLDSGELDARLLPYARLVPTEARMKDLLLADDVKCRLAKLAQEEKAILYFQGPYGVGKQTTAAALCAELGVGLLTIDVERLLKAEEGAFETTVQLAAREALLQNAAPYWDGFDGLLTDGKEVWRDVLVRASEEREGLTFLAGNTTWEPSDALHERPFVRIAFPRPTYAERVQLWEASLDGRVRRADDVDLEALANKFAFSGGQIEDAAATARNLARWRDPENGHVRMADLHAASCLQSNRKLATLAQKITPRYTWDDIVLPPDRLAQLHEICNTVRYRALVYETWGFDRKLSLGKGLNVLFAGPSGTGKTMAAEIIAGDLGLDLYKIDLSSVVSKYIGETEKNLARIFAEAETANAILFFDEADALFGKRSEVRDAHDRYANIEIGYLLQKMEEYEGIVILATNLRKNMDDAFVRRLHFTVELPFPGGEDRLRIWRKIWPDDTPRSEDLDLDFLARQLEIAGGNIRNIALAAAFLAAADGRVVDMRHLVRAARREYQKMGKVVAEGEFGEYEGYVRREAR